MSDPLGVMLSGLSDEAGPLLETQLQAHLSLGWQEIELRSVEGQAIADWEPEFFHKIRRAVVRAGLLVTVVASRIGNWERPITGSFQLDLEELLRVAERMQLLGAKYVRIMSYPNDGLSDNEWRDRVLERFHRLTETAAEAGIVLLHENCSGWAGTRPERAIDLLKEIDSPNLRLLFDTGNGIAYRYDTYEYLQQVWPYVAHVHVKDGVLLNGEAVYTLPGKGESKVRECLRWLLDHDYKGILAIEPHLHLIPHLRKAGDRKNLTDSYIDYGRHLGTLLEEMTVDSRPEKDCREPAQRMSSL
ncbi:sugar phosphate isomerase/epimerase [Paenibacillus sp. sptzw28]|uniref:sugar phosphate isomerase/epimerase family protein n=1 Tax=Paenibacillus sp. sptzw28 TaxID=715179 RepID=UPI001C6E5EF2|nr:sugar phosphate isomerase/epimerase family protein [Paenibacillus sp. sptzw28]QYR23485.1 sugar phosphate isomerase/epimerase [Paenibacillus sp. sptzw28]